MPTSTLPKVLIALPDVEKLLRERAKPYSQNKYQPKYIIPAQRREHYTNVILKGVQTLNDLTKTYHDLQDPDTLKQIIERVNKLGDPERLAKIEDKGILNVIRIVYLKVRRRLHYLRLETPELDKHPLHNHHIRYPLPTTLIKDTQIDRLIRNTEKPEISGYNYHKASIAKLRQLGYDLNEHLVGMARADKEGDIPAHNLHANKIIDLLGDMSQLAEDAPNTHTRHFILSKVRSLILHRLRVNNATLSNLII